MNDAHFLGEFESLELVWNLYPDGGCPGDWVVIDGQNMYWNDDYRMWGDEAAGKTPDPIKNVVHADFAYDLDEDSPVYDKMLRKDIEDRAHEKITFEKGVDVGGDAGFAGTLVSLLKKGKEYVNGFVSGVSGWIIKRDGEAEFKSIYARDRFVTNEFIYNRIQVTEDEEIISSSGKIDFATDNGDGTFTIGLDLREGDMNPFVAGDLVMGYYHNPKNGGLIYVVQKLTVLADPDRNDQTMVVRCEDGSLPYKYMIVVRVGNVENEERQAFVKISSKTNCLYFYDGITGWLDLDNPDKVGCVLGKVETRLVPKWASNVIGSARRWFGLIADGVILRGTFILKNNKTIEDELTGQITELAGRFEIRETGITGKWEETIRAAESADASEKAVTKMVGEFSVSAEKLASDFSKLVETKTTEATGEINETKETAISSLQLSAKDFTLDFENTVETKTTEAINVINETKDSAASSLQLTSRDLELGFNRTVETKTTEATGEINTVKESAKSELDMTAKGLTVDFNKTVETATTTVNGEMKNTKESLESSLRATAEELKTKFSQSVTDAEGNIIKEIGTQVTQNAKQWKVEVMGSDANGNPNTILAAINADTSGVKIKGDKVEIDGTLFAQMIMASGLNVNGKTIITKEGLFKTVDAVIEGSIAQSFKNLGTLTGNVTLDFSMGFNWAGETSSNITMYLPLDAPNGTFCAIFNGGPRRLTGTITVMQKYGDAFIDKRYLDNPELAVTKIKLRRNQMVELRLINAGTATAWRIMNYNDFSLSQEGGSYVLS